MRCLSTDLAVVGSGIAGLYAAILCRRAGLEVTLCSKSRPGRGSCSALSQGHFRSSAEHFPRSEHRQLTLEAGQGLNLEWMVDILVDRAREDVLSLNDLGVQLRQRTRGLESMPQRIGLEGLSITRPLADLAQSEGVQFLSPFFAWRIVELQGRAAGICGFLPSETEPTLVLAKGVILAAGGAGALYEWTDNPQGLSGDGYVLAYQAGLPLMDMEFVQFFPLTLAASSRTGRLVPPVVAEVGTLVNAGHEDLTAKYNITRRPVAVAARDQLSLAMAREIRAGQDIEGALKLEIPDDDRIWQQAGQAFGLGDLNRIKAWVDRLCLGKGHLLVRPAAHFVMGGLIIDAQAQTGIEGLFAAGEIVGGLHGANRYGGNALTETVVFAGIAADRAVLYLKEQKGPWPKDKAVLGWLKTGGPAWSRGQSDAPQTGPRLSEIRRSLQDLMWDQAGLIRSEESLALAETELGRLRKSLDRVRVGPENCIPYLEGQNRLLASEMIVKAARMRRESRGAHYRTDYPQTDPAWTRHIIIQKSSRGMQLKLLD
ncbi:MAG: FAD-dependent oxidoreductase [Desulfohalobiaceae bacterium]|nr:FAD-dependent oxidoreductase [Desulfohalobiaceae bacterium]